MKSLFMLILSAVVLVPSVNAQSMYVSSMKGNVNLRSAPSTSASKVGTLAAEDLLPCLEELDGWYKVSVNGKDAYVSQSVATTCDAVVPEEMFGKDFDSSKAWDKIRHQGTVRIDRIDDGHVFIYMEWMRINLPAESYSYVATFNDGKIVATHFAGMWMDSDRPLTEIMEDLYPLEKPIPMGYDEFNNTLYFNGAEFSEFN